MTLFWAFDSARSRDAGALPPESFTPGFGRREDALSGTDLQRAFATRGREVRPSDCGPIRLVARYGNVVRAPGRVVVGRQDPPSRWREHRDDVSSFGPVRVSGDPWHGSESGFVGSWIAGSEYVKISTGVLVFFPRSAVLIQGPLPNPGLDVGDPYWSPPALDVMTGVEYYTPRRSRIIGDEVYGAAAMNIIARVPSGADEVTLERGQVLGWFFVSLGLPEQRLVALPKRSNP